MLKAGLLLVTTLAEPSTAATVPKPRTAGESPKRKTKMLANEEAVMNIMGGMEHAGGIKLNDSKRKLKNRFEICKKLGQGTYGKVQLGINKETGQQVAIKTIKKSKIETEADLIRIRREIQIMSSVQHPNIIHIYEVFENKEKMVLVMEIAAGGELYDYLNARKCLEETEARRVFRQIATAVYYCHKHKICHRDLKLENILLDENGSAKIADFGLSNVFDGRNLLTTFCGSPLYASPEIVRGNPYCGPEVDCWSLGVLLYTLVYGAMPFDGSNFKRLVKQITTGDYYEPKPPSTASSLIRMMLTVNPDQRATISDICSNWWVNESYDKTCLEEAEYLSSLTPVRLDLLLSLAPGGNNNQEVVVDESGKATVVDGVAGPPVSAGDSGMCIEELPPEVEVPQGMDEENAQISISEPPDEVRSKKKEQKAKRKMNETPSLLDADLVHKKREKEGEVNGAAKESSKKSEPKTPKVSRRKKDPESSLQPEMSPDLPKKPPKHSAKTPQPEIVVDGSDKRPVEPVKRRASKKERASPLPPPKTKSEKAKEDPRRSRHTDTPDRSVRHTETPDRPVRQTPDQGLRQTQTPVREAPPPEAPGRPEQPMDLSIPPEPPAVQQQPPPVPQRPLEPPNIPQRNSSIRPKSMFCDPAPSQGQVNDNRKSAYEISPHDVEKESQKPAQIQPLVPQIPEPVVTPTPDPKPQKPEPQSLVPPEAKPLVSPLPEPKSPVTKVPDSKPLVIPLPEPVLPQPMREAAPAVPTRQATGAPSLPEPLSPILPPVKNIPEPMSPTLPPPVQVKVIHDPVKPVVDQPSVVLGPVPEKRRAKKIEQNVIEPKTSHSSKPVEKKDESVIKEPVAPAVEMKKEIPLKPKDGKSSSNETAGVQKLLQEQPKELSPVGSKPTPPVISPNSTEPTEQPPKNLMNKQQENKLNTVANAKPVPFQGQEKPQLKHVPPKTPDASPEIKSLQSERPSISFTATQNDVGFSSPKPSEPIKEYTIVLPPKAVTPPSALSPQSDSSPTIVISVTPVTSTVPFVGEFKTLPSEPVQPKKEDLPRSLINSVPKPFKADEPKAPLVPPPGQPQLPKQELVGSKEVSPEATNDSETGSQRTTRPGSALSSNGSPPGSGAALSLQRPVKARDSKVIKAAAYWNNFIGEVIAQNKPPENPKTLEKPKKITSAGVGERGYKDLKTAFEAGKPITQQEDKFQMMRRNSKKLNVDGCIPGLRVTDAKSTFEAKAQPAPTPVLYRRNSVTSSAPKWTKPPPEEPEEKKPERPKAKAKKSKSKSPNPPHSPIPTHESEESKPEVQPKPKIPEKPAVAVDKVAQEAVTKNTHANVSSPLLEVESHPKSSGQPKPPTSPKPKIRMEDLKQREEATKAASQKQKDNVCKVVKGKNDEGLVLIAPLKTNEPPEEATIKKLNDDQKEVEVPKDVKSAAAGVIVKEIFKLEAKGQKGEKAKKQENVTRPEKADEGISRKEKESPAVTAKATNGIPGEVKGEDKPGQVKKVEEQMKQAELPKMKESTTTVAEAPKSPIKVAAAQVITKELKKLETNVPAQQNEASPPTEAIADNVDVKNIENGNVPEAIVPEVVNGEEASKVAVTMPKTRTIQVPEQELEPQSQLEAIKLSLKRIPHAPAMRPKSAGDESPERLNSVKTVFNKEDEKTEKIPEEKEVTQPIPVPSQKSDVTPVNSPQPETPTSIPDRHVIEKETTPTNNPFDRVKPPPNFEPNRLERHRIPIRIERKPETSRPEVTSPESAAHVRGPKGERYIPIMVEGRGAVLKTPDPKEEEEKFDNFHQNSLSRRRWGSRKKRMSSAYSDSSMSDDDGGAGFSGPFGGLQRYSSVGKHGLEETPLFRLKKARPPFSLQRNESFSSDGEDDFDDDGFREMTAENLFSTLLSRVKSLTRRIHDEHEEHLNWQQNQRIVNHALNPGNTHARLERNALRNSLKRSGAQTPTSFSRQSSYLDDSSVRSYGRDQDPMRSYTRATSRDFSDTDSYDLPRSSRSRYGDEMSDAASDFSSNISVTSKHRVRPGYLPPPNVQLEEARLGRSAVERTVPINIQRSSELSSPSTSKPGTPVPINFYLKQEDEGDTGGRRVSRFLRPDFYDTPKEDSIYAKMREIEEEDRKKSRFLKAVQARREEDTSLSEVPADAHQHKTREELSAAPPSEDTAA